jgi:hypothetical protein
MYRPVYDNWTDTTLGCPNGTRRDILRSIVHFTCWSIVARDKAETFLLLKVTTGIWPEIVVIHFTLGDYIFSKATKFFGLVHSVTFSSSHFVTFFDVAFHFNLI